MGDMQLGNDETPPVVTVLEASRRLGRSVDGVRGLVRRGKLKARRSNSGQLLIELPPGAAEAATAGDEPTDEPGDAATSTAFEALRDELEEARDRVEHWRHQAEEARLAAAKAEGEVAAQRSLIDELKASHREVVQELRAELDWRRRPAWRRLLGR